MTNPKSKPQRRNTDDASRQRALIDELLQETARRAGVVPPTPEICELLGEYIPYSDSLSDEIIAMRYEGQQTISHQGRRFRIKMTTPSMQDLEHQETGRAQNP